MISDGDIDVLMEYATNDAREQLAEFMGRMDDADKSYFKGFIDGYVTATGHAQMAHGDAQGAQ